MVEKKVISSTRQGYVPPKIEVYAVAHHAALLDQSFTDEGNGHNDGNGGNHYDEAKEFGFDETWGGELWD